VEISAYAQDPARTGSISSLQGESVDQVKKDMEFPIGETPHMRTPALWVTGSEARRG